MDSAWQQYSDMEFVVSCSVTVQDIWTLYREETRIVIDPRVLVAYEGSVFAEIDMARRKAVNAC